MSIFHHPVTGERLTAEDIWGTANMMVVFEDGSYNLYRDVRFLMVRGFVDPITVKSVDGHLVLEFENVQSDIITLLNVRSYMLDYTDVD